MTGPEECPSHRLQEGAARLLSEVKSLFRASQNAINHFVKGSDALLDIYLDVLKEYLEKNLRQYDGYLEIDQVKSTLDTLKGQSLFSGVKSSSQLDKFIAQKVCVDPDKKLMQIVFSSKVVTVNGKLKTVPQEYGYYITFLPQLEQLLNCKDVFDCVKNPKPAPKGEFKSVTDGYLYKHHIVFKNHRTGIVLAIVIYADDVEFTDPCKSKTKKHRLRLYYWSLGNISPELRSSLKAINLLALAKTSTAKKYGNEPFLADFLAGLKLLGDGVTFEIFGEPTLIHGMLLCCCGDTPQQSNMGGFKESHFALRPCRFCMVTRFNMCNTFVEDNKTLRDFVSHRQHLKKVVEFLDKAPKPTTVPVEVASPAQDDDEDDDDDLMQVETQDYYDHLNPSVNYGINGPSCLSSAPGWDECKAFPLDIMHVLNEGCVQNLCRLVIKDLVTKPAEGPPIYSLQYINQVMKNLCNFGNLTVDKPSEIEAGHLKKKLRQSAAQMYALLRFLPFITFNHLSHKKHNLLILMQKILDITMSFHVKLADISTLEELVKQFGEDFVAEYPKNKSIKLHSLVHLPMNMKLFGSLRHVWCFRYEAFHRIFTSLVDVVNSMKNIELTMATRYILRRDTEMGLAEDGKFLAQEEKFSGCKTVLLTDLPIGYLSLIEPHVTDQETVSVTSVSSFQKHSNVWRENEVLMLEENGSLSTFAAVKNIYVMNDEVIFLCSSLSTKYDADYHAFTITGSPSAFSAVKLSQLAHPYPLTKFTFNFKRSSITYILVTRPTDM